MIFEMLNLKDLARLRCTSKRFRSICEIVRVRELLICDEIDKSHETPSFWFQSNRAIHIEDAIRFDTFAREFDPFYSDKLRLQTNLKRLHFGYDCEYLNFDFRLLDLFVGLEQLEIRRPILGCQKLSCPNLRTLLVSSIDSWIYFGLRVACPKLEALRAEDLQIVQVELKQSIRHLEICYEEVEELAGFKWLQCLVIDYPLLELFGDEEALHLDLSNFVALQKLNICIGPCSFDDRYQQFGVALKSILKQKETLRRADLKICLDGIELTADDFERFSSLLMESPFAPLRYFKPFQ